MERQDLHLSAPPRRSANHQNPVQRPCRCQHLEHQEFSSCLARRHPPLVRQQGLWKAVRAVPEKIEPPPLGAHERLKGCEVSDKPVAVTSADEDSSAPVTVEPAAEAESADSVESGAPAVPADSDHTALCTVRKELWIAVVPASVAVEVNGPAEVLRHAADREVTTGRVLAEVTPARAELAGPVEPFVSVVVPAVQVRFLAASTPAFPVPRAPKGETEPDTLPTPDRTQSAGETDITEKLVRY